MFCSHVGSVYGVRQSSPAALRDCELGCGKGHLHPGRVSLPRHTAVEIDIMHFGGVIMGLDTQSTNPIDYGSNIIIMQIRRE